jgi:hypothetical protein
MVTMREVNAFWRTEFGGRDMVDLTVAPLKIRCSYEAGDTFTVEFFSLPHTTSGVRFFG